MALLLPSHGCYFVLSCLAVRVRRRHLGWPRDHREQGRWPQVLALQQQQQETNFAALVLAAGSALPCTLMGPGWTQFFFILVHTWERFPPAAEPPSVWAGLASAEHRPGCSRGWQRETDILFPAATGCSLAAKTKVYKFPARGQIAKVQKQQAVEGEG